MSNSSDQPIIINNDTTPAQSPSVDSAQTRITIQRVNSGDLSSVTIRLEGRLNIWDNRELLRECVEAIRAVWVRHKNAQFCYSANAIVTGHQSGSVMWTDVLENDRPQWGS